MPDKERRPTGKAYKSSTLFTNFEKRKGKVKKIIDKVRAAAQKLRDEAVLVNEILCQRPRE